MAKAAKRQPKEQHNTSKSSSGAGIPSPFVTAPTQLESFLGALDPAQIYITHVDNLPWQFKRQVFAVPLTLNVGIALLLAWRVYVIWPTYLDLLTIALGFTSPQSIDTMSRSNNELRWIVLKRTAMVLFDFVLFRFVGFWPFVFFFEQPISPALWRWRLGFQDTEVVVRVSKQWGAKDFWDATKSFRGRVVNPNTPVLRDRILPAIDTEWMRTRTGYMMMNADYDLDLPAMLDAEGMVQKGQASYTDFTKAVFVHLEDAGWCMWKIEEGQSTVASDTDLDEQEARQRIEGFRERLKALGKEDLFYRWIEMLQFETQQPGGLRNTERQAHFIEKARNLFVCEGVDFDKLFSSVGGAGGFPGLGKND